MISKNLKKTFYPPIVSVNEQILELKQKGFEIINMGQAVVNLNPPQNFIETLNKFYQDKRMHYYSPDIGYPFFRENLLHFLNKHFNSNIKNIDNLLITAGANQGVSTLLMTILEPEDEVIIPAPYYFNHIMAVDMLGAKNIIINTKIKNNFQLKLEDIEKYYSPKTKAIILVTPNNPTGLTYNKKETEKIIQFCEEKNILLIFDETYNLIFFNEKQSFIDKFKNNGNIAIVGSFSKSFAIAGWRIGYILLPDYLIKDYIKVQDTFIISPSSPAQLFLNEYLEKSEEYLININTVLKNRANLLYNNLNKKEQTIFPEGGCFLWYKLPNTNKTSAELAFSLLEKYKVAVIPGEVFGNSYKNYWRISFGSVDEDDIKLGAEIINNFFDLY